MKIPEFLREKYRSDGALVGFVESTIAKIDAHVDANRMVFFPEYTDHSITHFELVLQTAVDLATDRSKELMTAADAGMLVTATSLHDFGMYLTRDGFQTLIADESRWPGIAELGDSNWKSLWADFYSEATRFDDRKLRSLFGDEFKPVRHPPVGVTASWEDFDYLLVGEFLRRHHPRLAFDIATNGLPAKDGKAIPICPSDGERNVFLSHMSGLLARSHGMDLRPCLDFIEGRYGNKVNPRGVSAAFVAVLIRVADYFQIQESRAPSARTDVDTIKSHVSNREWTVHQSVNDIFDTTEDPEALRIEASPSDVASYLRIKEWLGDLQAELDKSWAVLGETFGRQSSSHLDELGIRTRRIKSNLDDVSQFARSVHYIPARISFETATADLLKLLVGPLYGDDPGVGVRELLQNAVDAVREFEDLAEHHPSLANVNRRVQDADIVLEVVCDESREPTEVVVSDRGIGMSVDVVREYFLRAGASFRKSESWRIDHEDPEGRSRVLRTGRFGVGVLAAFLLGDRIEVTTRHARDKENGLRFVAQLERLQRVAAPVGTIIRIFVPKQMRSAVGTITKSSRSEGLDFGDKCGHYFLQKPSLDRKFTCSVGSLRPKKYLPLPDHEEDEDWRRFSNKYFQRVFWTYSFGYPSAACNGIVLDSSLYYWDRQLVVNYISRPKLSFFDKDGYLQLDLQRTKIVSDDGFRDDLLRSIVDDLIAYALATAPTSYNGAWLDGEYKGFRRRSRSGSYLPTWCRWFSTKHGAILNDPHLLQSAGINTVVSVVGGRSRHDDIGRLLQSAASTDAVIAWSDTGAFSGTSPSVKGRLQRLVDHELVDAPFKAAAARLFVPEALPAQIRKLRPGRNVRERLRRIDAAEKRGSWRVLEDGSPSPGFDGVIEGVKTTGDNLPIFCVYAVDTFNVDEVSDVVATRWMEVLGTPFIPYGRSKRSRLVEQLDEKNRRRVDLHKAEQAARRRRAARVFSPTTAR